MNRKNTKLIKQPTITFQQPKTIENPNIVDIKSVNIEYPKTLNKVFKSMRQAKKVSPISGAGKKFDSLYIVKKKKSEKVMPVLVVLKLAWIIDPVINYNINIAKYNTLVGSSYIKFSKALDHPKKGLINIQNTVEN